MKELTKILDLSGMPQEYQIIFLKIMTCLLGITLFIIFLIGIAYLVQFICDKEFETYWSIKKDKERLIYKKLNMMLMDICDQLKIKVFIKSDEWFRENAPKDAGYISYRMGVLYDVQDAEIYLRDDKMFDHYGWETFAHEIGHYLSINLYNDRSEEGADYEADRMIRSLLSEEDLIIINDSLKIFFDDISLEKANHHYRPVFDPSPAEELKQSIYKSRMGVYDYTFRTAAAKIADNEEIKKEEEAIKIPFYAKSYFETLRYRYNKSKK